MLVLRDDKRCVRVAARASWENSFQRSRRSHLASDIDGVAVPSILLEALGALPTEGVVDLDEGGDRHRGDFTAVVFQVVAAWQGTGSRTVRSCSWQQHREQPHLVLVAGGDVERRVHRHGGSRPLLEDRAVGRLGSVVDQPGGDVAQLVAQRVAQLLIVVNHLPVQQRPF